MTRAKTKTRGTGRLRRRAEAWLKQSPQAIPRTFVEAERDPVHELRVHEVELETQNEELRRVQLESETSRDRFARLYDLAPVGYLTLDAEGLIHEANLTAARLLGLERRTLLKKKLSRFIVAESQEDFDFHRQRVFTNAERQTCDLQMHQADGATFNGRLESIREPAVGGHSARCLVLLRDVTRPLRAEALRQSEANYRALFELNPAPMWICDETTLEFLDVNEAALKLYGWSRREFLRLTAKDVRPPEEVPEFLRQVKQQAGSRVNFVGERRHLKHDGTVFDVAVTISSIPYAGRAARLALVNDITERKRFEVLLKQLNATLEQRIAERTEELNNANERLQAVMGTALIGIIALDERGIIKSLNPAAEQIFGYTPHEMVGCSVSRLMAWPDQAPRESFLGHYHQVSEGQGLGVRGEVLGRAKSGRGIMLELSVAEFPDGGQRHFVAMVRDITKRKRLERELLEAGELERQRLGHDLHDGLGQHLHALFYMATLLEKELKEDSPERAQEAGRLARQLEHGLKLIRSLARGLQPVNAVPEGLMAALRELAERTRAMYGVDSHFRCPAPVMIHRHSAANHLYRIAQEAVNNAMKHGKPTRIRIQLTATPKTILLGVRDNGRGIGRRRTRSPGMGLHVMQYRADALSGSLVVHRHPQGGTEVVCTVKRQALLPEERNLK